MGCPIPVANGIQLLQEILHFGGTSTPIIFVTGKGDKMIFAQALKAGVLDYIPNKNYPRSFISMYPNVIKVQDLELRAKQAEYLLVETGK